MLSLEEKNALLDELRKNLKTEYETLEAAQRATVEGATHEEARPENDKDTRALEQSYLARGQAERVLTLTDDLNLLGRFVLRAFTEDNAISLGALVCAEDEAGKQQLYFLAPSGAGEQLESRVGKVKVVTGQSPLGRALMGSRVDEDIEIMSPTGKRTLTLTELC